MSPFRPVIRILMRRISYLAYACGKLVLHDAGDSEGSSLIDVVKRQVHDVVHIDINRGPRVQIEHMRCLAVSLRL